MLRNTVRPEKKYHARALRKRPNLAEKTLWERLRRKQLGIRFKRQVILRGYIVDFYAPKAHLVVEVNGEWHKDMDEYDRIRNQALRKIGILPLRFANHEVLEETHRVVSYILELVQKRLRAGIMPFHGLVPDFKKQAWLNSRKSELSNGREPALKLKTIGGQSAYSGDLGR